MKNEAEMINKPQGNGVLPCFVGMGFVCFLPMLGISSTAKELLTNK